MASRRARVGLARHALGDSVVVAVDEGPSGPIVGFAGRGGDEITHVERDRDDVADALVTWLLEVDETAPITVWDGADSLARAVLRAGLEPVGRQPWSGMLVDVASVRDNPRRHVDGYAFPSGPCRRDRCSGRSASRTVVSTARRRSWRGWLRWTQIAPPAAPSPSMTIEPPALDVDRILTTLDRHEVDFVLVGGVAAIAYGARRPTAVLDCVARRSSGNLERLAAALRSLNARLRAHGLTDEEAALLPTRVDKDTLGRMEISTWRTDAGDFDVLTDLPAVTGAVCATTS